MLGRTAEQIAAHAASAWTASPWTASLPPNGSLHGIAIDHLMRINLLLIVGAFLLANGLLLAAFFKPRKSGSWRGKILVIEVAALAVISLGYVWMTFSSERLWARNRYAGPSPAAMQVEVVGVQFQWYFRYPGQDETFGAVKPKLIDPAGGNPLGLDPGDPNGRDDVVASELVLPVGREVDLRLRAQDVMHGFFIPGMRLKEDTVPGMVLHVHFTPVARGVYPILCSQLCGIGHERMQARLLAVSPAEYAAWLAGRERAQLAQRRGQ